MTVTRGFLLALALAVATPAAAQSRGNQRRPDPPRDNQSGRFDSRDTRDLWNRRIPQRFDLAYVNGEEDGYEAGLKDARRGDRFDPIREKRYRSADHGYDRRYGPRDFYKNRYRDGFRRGYEEGYRDGLRRFRRDRRGPGWWWPFGR